ncbi:MAG: TetR/AcrR family transcriptional regulator [Parvibaculaceae bacterium]
MTKKENISDESSTRERILEAALELFGEHGFAGTSMRMLARATSLRESSIYNHFSGKEGLYQCVMEQWGPAEFVERLKSAEYKALANDPRALFQLCCKHLIDRWLDPREHLFMAMTSKEGRGSEAREGLYKALFVEEIDLLGRYIAGFVKAGLVHAPDPHETARIFCAGLTFTRMEHLMWTTKLSGRKVIERAVQRYVDNFLALIEVRTAAVKPARSAKTK